MAIVHGGDIFALARERGWDWREVLDCSASINPLGPAPGVQAAICQAMERIVHYPEREPAPLRRALAQEWQLDEEQILLGNGATDLIFFAARILAHLPVTLGLPVFSEFNRAFPNAAHASLTNCASWPLSGLLVLTRPANPTGWTLSLEAIRAWLESTDTHLLIDESFLEFSERPSAAELIAGYPRRLIVMRSLTKFYALPGLRVGALIGSPEVVQAWRQQREPWQVNVLAEAAALAALADKEHALRSLEFMRSERASLAAQLNCAANDGNFLYVPLSYPAQNLCAHMLEHKILIRNCTGWPGLAGEAVRVAVRRRDENLRLLEAWRQFR
ncbi:MAG TPA: aminotransferase class I/II-fold pyridoxal phosphate-dependent enzyme [Bryobacteraceae bacterium]|nr:aminotransferase class I/II-fold pyridoxal phosphate-dependent enzyme [Bryobacteraceae bacterium]